MINNSLLFNDDDYNNNNTTSIDTDAGHSLAYYVLTVLTNCLVSILIIVNNILTLLTLLKTKKLHTLPNAYVASLSVADLLVGILLVVRNFWLLPSTEWVFNENKFACIPFTCLLYINGSESIFCLVLVSWDRYMFIIHPFWYKRTISNRFVGILILISWLFSVPFGLLPLWINNFTTEKGCDPMSFVPAAYFIGQLVFFFASAFAIAFMYGRIYHVMGYQRRKLEARMALAHCQGRRHSNRWQVIRFLIFVCAMFFICWTPGVIMLPLSMVLNIPEIVVSITVSLAALNSACNIFAFIVMSANFRHALAAMVCKRKSRTKVISGNELRAGNQHDIAVVATARLDALLEGERES